MEVVASAWRKYAATIIPYYKHICCTNFSINSPLGVLSAVEIIALTILAIVALIINIAQEYSASGKFNTQIMFVGIILGFKNNIMNLVLGISFERALYLHKCLFTISWMMTFIHGIPQLVGFKFAGTDLSNVKVNGLVLFVLMTFQLILYYVVKTMSFELFFYMHIATYGAIIYMAIRHEAKLIAFSLVFMAADLIVRFFIKGKRVTVQLQSLNKSKVTCLKFKKLFHYEAGQYAFVMIPSLGIHQYHPFTISSIPSSDDMTMHIKALGDWTKALNNMSFKDNAEVTCFIEGPFGRPMMDPFNDSSYQVYILLCGGIGMTPIQAWANHLLHLHASKKKVITKIYYVWSMREDMTQLLNELVTTKMLPLSTSSEMRALPASQDIEGGDGATHPAADSKVSSEVTPGNILDTGIYITGVNGDDAEKNIREGIDPLARDCINFKRPNLSEIFDKASLLASTSQQSRVLVAACGPPSLIDDAVKLCKGKSGKGVNFDLHTEIFNY